MIAKRAVFEIKQNPTGKYYFTFHDSECITTVISHSFSNRSELESCISNTRDVAMIADIHDSLMPRGSPPYFVVKNNEEGSTFSLIGFHGETIFSSVLYLSETQCKEAIHVLKTFSLKAGIVDLTID
ncbi:MAG: hypothetical protein ACOX4U_05115 [Anaerovoracaceae bacterium]|jgi:uncharacterized protein YegP (UPF0339 family)